MKKKMGCKAPGEAKYRSNLMVVRILANRATQPDRFLFAFSLKLNLKSP